MLSINCKGRLVSFDAPKVMGILNTTPDSFYSKSRKFTVDDALKAAQKMLEDGALFLDIGGQSTRPGSERINAEDEAERVIPIVKAVARRFPQAIISIDTFYAAVAEAAVDEGATIVNDVSAGTIDSLLLSTVARLDVPYVLMHMQGDPQTMQKAPYYKDVVLDVFDALHFKMETLINVGIKDVIVDPGFGFGKTIAHNFALLNGLAFFQQLQAPLMVGLSRKGTVYKTLGITPEDALNGTTVLHTIALENEAQILRVHDVKEAVQAITLVQALKASNTQ